MGLLKAAAGKIDLAPPEGGWMTGYGGRAAPSTGLHDPLMARAVLLDDGANRLAIVSCDLLGLAPDVVDRVRQRIRGKTGIEAGQIVICCTHTHSGPASMPMRGHMGYVYTGWLRATQAKLVGLVTDLAGRLEPARLAFGSTTVTGIGFNRQDNSKPIDEELGTISVERPDGRAIATLVNYAVHAVVLGPQNLEYSGDFPGATTRRIDELTGGVGIYLQGACGDVDPITQIQKSWGRGTFEDCEVIGNRLAEAALDALKGVERTAEVVLGCGRCVVGVPLDPPPSLEELERLISQFRADRKAAVAAPARDQAAELTAKAMLSWARKLRNRIRTGDVPTTLSAEVFAAKINSLRIVGLPFETYTDIGLGIKNALKPLNALIVGYANGLYGYCPTSWAKDQGGYGADASCRWFDALLTPVGRGADELLISAGVGLARSL
ncbi:MAG: neutral/alkaline non-lysosomal ceramidase N-terminal domain-containing protein [Armatimonadota bacterium]